MNITRLEYLLDRSIAQQASLEELQEMEQLMAQPENEDLVKELFLVAYERPKELVDLDQEKSDAILEAIFQSQNQSKTFSFRGQWIKWVGSAAALIVFGFTGSYFFSKREKSLQPVAQVKTNDVKPGGNKAILTLANGSKIALTDSTNPEILKQSGMLISKAEDGQLVYKISSPTNGEVAYNTIETPNGGQYQIILPDGTKVWLNAASSLRYPLVFPTNERNVVLNGEAYFEVAKNKNQPFKVISKTQVIEVLGTHFNVNAYADEQAVKTTLLEGSVKVKQTGSAEDRILRPGQQAILNLQGITTEEVDTETAVAWKNGYFRFNGEGIEGIMRKLSRWYDVNIEFKGANADEKFNGTISRDKNISQVLEMLETTNAVHFKVEGRRVTVMK